MKSRILLLSLLSCLFLTADIHAQFTHQDTLRGTNTPERAWWDVLYYTIGVSPDYASKTIEGGVIITFKVVTPGNRMQIDLQQPMELNTVQWKEDDLSFTREGNVCYITFPRTLKPGTVEELSLRFSGKPRQAVRPPWDGGWIWAKDKMGRPWITVACEGLGASSWFPCKDYQGDEPDNGASLTLLVPDTLMAVANGRLTDQHAAGNSTSFTWEVKNPINNYNIIPYIGKYVNWTDVYKGDKGPLDCSYWVLDYDLDKAKVQFGRDVHPMLKAFEYWFGPYPFYEDGYKLVETPHLGMEHQSAIAYGNEFRNGYRGRDLSASGWGLKWDFIIVHESGHEWFGNNITSKDVADMWVHEGFTNYSETLFTDYLYGKAAGNAYCQGTRALIQNDRPIIGTYGVNREGSSDMYYKGGNLIHTIRQVINNDEKFRQILRGLNKDFYHQTVTSSQVENYISKKSGIDFSKVFDQYLRTVKIPVLEYRISGTRVSFRWTNCVEGFNLSVRTADGKRTLHPSTSWQETKLPAGAADLTIDPDYYIKTKKTEP